MMLGIVGIREQQGQQARKGEGEGVGGARLGGAGWASVNKILRRLPPELDPSC